ncbi:MAG: HAMP domain-containing histidine kinase [Oscillospiraceae bacterium]|nr:HAMP domain-containing histidine kinase [Oscillospiraceae bacterium]
MKTRFIVLYAVVFLLLSIAVTMHVLHGGKTQQMPQHTTEINRLLIRLADDWETVSANDGQMCKGDEDFDYAVIDRDGALLFATRRGISETVSAATSHYDIIRDIEIDGEVVGRLIVHNDAERFQRESAARAAALIGGLSLLMLAVSLSYCIYLKKRIVEPFGKLEGFAEKIAAGDLETPLEMDRDNIFGAFTESFDIMREELKASRQREEAAVRSRKEMIAELSHDIKTPVASIKAMVDFLSLTTEDEAQQETLSAINAKTDQINKLVSNLFHATLEELEQLEVHPEELPSSELARIIVESDHLKKIVRSEIQDCVILADPLRLEQIIGNLISNSYKYADTEITVDSRFEDNCLLVELSDKGGGVPDAEIDFITEKFRRGSNAAGKDGAGIGLYLSRYFMTKMGGELTFRNNGEGFTAELRFVLA